MIDNQPLVMTVEEVATYLRIPQSSVYKLAQEGMIPCQEVGGRWRFHRRAIDQRLALSSRRHPDVHSYIHVSFTRFVGTSVYG